MDLGNGGHWILLLFAAGLAPSVVLLPLSAMPESPWVVTLQNSLVQRIDVLGESKKSGSAAFVECCTTGTASGEALSRPLSKADFRGEWFPRNHRVQGLAINHHRAHLCDSRADSDGTVPKTLCLTSQSLR